MADDIPKTDGAGAGAGEPSEPQPESNPSSQLSEKAWGLLGASFQACSLTLAHEHGVLKALPTDAAAGLTSDAVAAKCSTHPRFTHELLLHLTANEWVSRTDDGTFYLSSAQSDVLLDSSSPYFALLAATSVPQYIAPKWDRHTEAFRTGKGVSYDEAGPGLAAAVATFTADAGTAVENWIRATPDVLAALEAPGAAVADVGCGSGKTLVHLATAFPTTTFHAYDTSVCALENARKAVDAAGVGDRVHLHNPSEGDGMPEEPTFDLIYNVDVLHDMTDARPVLTAGRKAIKPTGMWLAYEPEGGETDEENLAKPTAKLLLGFSMYVCMTASMCEGHGPGIGTMGFSTKVATEWFTGAGWARVERTKLEDLPNSVHVAYAT